MHNAQIRMSLDEVIKDMEERREASLQTIRNLQAQMTRERRKLREQEIILKALANHRDMARMNSPEPIEVYELADHLPSR